MSEVKTFNQEEVNQIVADRLARAKVDAGQIDEYKGQIESLSAELGALKQEKAEREQADKQAHYESIAAAKGFDSSILDCLKYEDDEQLIKALDMIAPRKSGGFKAGSAVTSEAEKLRSIMLPN